MFSVSRKLYQTTARLDVIRIAGVASWDLWDKGINCNNSLCSEAMRIILQEGDALILISVVGTYDSAGHSSCNEEDHMMYQMIIGSYYEPEQLVFVDESALDRCVSHHPYVWASIGSCVRRRNFFICGKQCTFH